MGVLGKIVKSVIGVNPTGGLKGDVRNKQAAGVPPTQRIVNGNFSSATNWTPGAGWVIAAGNATATTTVSVLSNLLSSPIPSNATITFSVNITSNTIGDQLIWTLFNTGGSTEFQSGSQPTTTPGIYTVQVTAGATGPYDTFRIRDIDATGTVVIDDVSILA